MTGSRRGRWPPSDATGSPACVQSACLLHHSRIVTSCHINRSIDHSGVAWFRSSSSRRRKFRVVWSGLSAEWSGQVGSSGVEWSGVNSRSRDRSITRSGGVIDGCRRRSIGTTAHPAERIPRISVQNSERLSALTLIVACRARGPGGRGAHFDGPRPIRSHSLAARVPVQPSPHRPLACITVQFPLSAREADIIRSADMHHSHSPPPI